VLSEFEIIERFFTRNKTRQDVVLSVGDDCALLKPPADKLLAVSTDTLVESIHFLPQIPADALGYKAMTAGLSDLAAMGARPAWTMLSLTLPQADENWLRLFSQGFFELIDQHDVDLVGGNISRGPLSINVTVFGFIDEGKALRRDGAKPGDLIYVSGDLGLSMAALRVARGELTANAQQQNSLFERWYRPQPRIALGLELKNIASAAIDISDGLAADLSHILKASQCGATISVESLPVASGLFELLEQREAIEMALTAGEAYELCFTVPENKAHLVDKTCICIGSIEQRLSLRVKYADGSAFELSQMGHQHF